MARAPERPQSELTSAGVTDLLRRGCWASVPAGTIESLMDGGRVIEFPAGHTVYAEADAERLGRRSGGSASRLHACQRRTPGHRAVCTERAICWVCRRSSADPHRSSCRLWRQARPSSSTSIASNERRDSDASVAWALAEESVHRLYDVLEELAGNAFASVRQRVARHLLDLAASRPASGRAHRLRQSAGSREQRGIGSGSGRARPRRASEGAPRPNVARPCGDSRSRSDEPPVLVARA